MVFLSRNSESTIIEFRIISSRMVSFTITGRLIGILRRLNRRVCLCDVCRHCLLVIGSVEIMTRSIEREPRTLRAVLITIIGTCMVGLIYGFYRVLVFLWFLLLLLSRVLKGVVMSILTTFNKRFLNTLRRTIPLHLERSAISVLTNSSVLSRSRCRANVRIVTNSSNTRQLRLLQEVALNGTILNSRLCELDTLNTSGLLTMRASFNVVRLVHLQFLMRSSRILVTSTRGVDVLRILCRVEHGLRSLVLVEDARISIMVRSNAIVLNMLRGANRLEAGRQVRNRRQARRRSITEVSFKDDGLRLIIKVILMRSMVNVIILIRRHRQGQQLQFQGSTRVINVRTIVSRGLGRVLASAIITHLTSGQDVRTHASRQSSYVRQ